ncbi:hypothetical protein C8R45DRAFT_1223460 [Mycena sanguinolenta]|nr:hypothetical protein C8R45DRAFT_1224741 [Mycena sanguinolenta]KAJ6452669.1 hypothetical protein C8R45DRAFT_1223460 [Mycena sanguinolenta]
MQTVGLDEATIAYDHRIHRYFYLTGIVLLFYDTLLTLDLEVRYIWKGPRPRASAWFLLIRYSSLCLRIMTLVIFDFGDFDPEVCKKLNTIDGLLTVIQELLVGCTLILRVLAMYSFNKRILITLVTAAIVCGGVAAWCTVPDGSSPTLAPTNVSGCIFPYSYSQLVIHIRVQSFSTHDFTGEFAAAWEAMLAGDVLLLGLTLYWAYSNNRDIHAGSLWRVLIGDGKLIGVLLALVSTDKHHTGALIIGLGNLANILTFYFGDAIIPNSLGGFTAAEMNSGTMDVTSLRFASSGSSDSIHLFCHYL